MLQANDLTNAIRVFWSTVLTVLSRPLPPVSQQNQELGVRLGTLVHTEGGLQASNQRLKDAQDVLREEDLPRRRYAARPPRYRSQRDRRETGERLERDRRETGE